MYLYQDSPLLLLLSLVQQLGGQARCVRCKDLCATSAATPEQTLCIITRDVVPKTLHALPNHVVSILAAKLYRTATRGDSEPKLSTQPLLLPFALCPFKSLSGVPQQHLREDSKEKCHVFFSHHSLRRCSTSLKDCVTARLSHRLSRQTYNEPTFLLCGVLLILYQHLNFNKKLCVSNNIYF